MTTTTLTVGTTALLTAATTFRILYDKASRTRNVKKQSRQQPVMLAALNPTPLNPKPNTTS